MSSLWTPKRSFVTAGDLYDRSKESGEIWLEEGLPPATKVILGSSDNIELDCGLAVHFSDSQELDDLTIKTNTSAHIGVRLFLEGDIDARIGEQMVPMPKRSPENGQWQPVASIFSQIRQESFQRKVRKGDRVRKVIISMSHEWLNQQDLGEPDEAHLIKQFTDCHMACKSWDPSPAALAWAEQIIHPPDLPRFLLKLYVQSRVFSLIAEAFAQILRPEIKVTNNQLRPQDHQRITRIETYLEHHSTDNIKAADLADAAGVSVNTLQRLCQGHYGASVSEFIRRWRMEKARHALEIEGITIAEAAFLAGYGGPANFSTAFKRHFGVSPSEVIGGW